MQAIAAAQSVGMELFGELAVEDFMLSSSRRAPAQAQLIACPVCTCAGSLSVLGWALPCVLSCLVQQTNKTWGYNAWGVAFAVSRAKATLALGWDMPGTC